MSVDLNNYTLTGCLFEQRPSAAPTLESVHAMGADDLPERVDLRIHCSPVEDQLKTSSCVANAVVGALEMHQKKAGLPLTDLSRLFVYYNARMLSDTELKDSGSFIHHGMAAILAYGACEARMWPYQVDMLTTKPTNACYENARDYDAVKYARTPRGASALQALAQGLPIVFGMYAPMEYYNVAHKTGVMPTPDQMDNSRPPAGHAMLIVGYDLSDKTYLVRNSWGVSLFDGGYLRIPFETMDAWSKLEDFWTIGAIEQAKGFEIRGPSIVDAMQSVGVPDDALSAVRSGLGRMRSDLRARLSSDLETAKRNFRGSLRDKK